MMTGEIINMVGEINVVNTEVDFSGRGRDYKWTKTRECVLKYNSLSSLTEGYTKVFGTYKSELSKPIPLKKGF